MSASRPFGPAYGSGQTVTSTVTPADAAALNKGDQQVVVSNTGTNVGYVRIAAAGNASAADYLVQPGQQVPLTKDGDATRLSHYSPSGTTFHIISGSGW